MGTSSLHHLCFNVLSQFIPWTKIPSKSIRAFNYTELLYNWERYFICIPYHVKWSQLLVLSNTRQQNSLSSLPTPLKTDILVTTSICLGNLSGKFLELVFQEISKRTILMRFFNFIFYYRSFYVFLYP
jgi:hypothetical protein